jgi:hypothetical protein
MFANDTLSPKLIKNSFGDGIFATVFATLTSGVFLTGFAIYLGMDEFAIGLLAAIPAGLPHPQRPERSDPRFRPDLYFCGVVRDDQPWLFAAYNGSV